MLAADNIILAQSQCCRHTYDLAKSIKIQIFYWSEINCDNFIYFSILNRIDDEVIHYAFGYVRFEIMNHKLQYRTILILIKFAEYRVHHHHQSKYIDSANFPTSHEH